ncbi:MAG: GGDEF domain-containing protein [Acidobacteriota bacterium]|jgi:diguanylate cyclase (GGDEF)-like protein|nr:GGDEF domain-containing protein [Acidobacteriota bacterium]
MNGLAKACTLAAWSAWVFLAGGASIYAANKGVRPLPIETGGLGEEASPVAVSFPVNWLIDYSNQIIGVLMITLSVLLLLYMRQQFLYMRQQKLHDQRTHQLENLVAARTQELERANADLKRLSITDPLTGAKNRRFVEFSISEDLARIRRSAQEATSEWGAVQDESSSISFLMVDIDFFKLVNDRYGHAAGDQVLRQMSALFASMVRESDTIVRWGGEEFLIIARNPKANDTTILAERLRKRVASYPFVISEQQAIRVTCSIGFASWPFFLGEPDLLGWEAVVSLADRSLYKAKDNGRNAWCGIVAHPGYKAPVTPEVMNDPDAAEKKGIVAYQASYDAAVDTTPPAQAEKPLDLPPRSDLVQDAVNHA